MKYKISVIIPVYNRIDELKLTLNTLRAQTLPKSEFEVVIADDGSAQDIPGLLKQYVDLNIIYCRQEDLGFRVAAVRNLGIKNAQGEILVFNDNGILFTPTVLEEHVKLHSERGNLVVLGYMFGTNWQCDTDKIRNLLDEKTTQDAIAVMKEHGGMGDGREGYITRFGEDISSWYIPWLALWGGHFSVRRDFIDAHNIAFDEAFTSWGGEDNDFGIQLCRAGCYYLLARGIEVVHYPTPNRANSDISTEDFKKHYKTVVAYIAEKHKTEDVIAWQSLGSSVNDAEKRKEFLKDYYQKN